MPGPDPAEILQHVIDAFPQISMVVDNDVCVVAFNTSASRSLQLSAADLRQLTGNVLSCVNALEYGCGRTRQCNGCDVRLSILRAFEGQSIQRRPTRMRLRHQGQTHDAWLLVSTTPLTDRQVMLVVEDISEMAALAGLLPVCSRCGAPRPGATHVADALAYLESHADLPLPFWRCQSCELADDPGGRKTSGRR